MNIIYNKQKKSNCLKVLNCFIDSKPEQKTKKYCCCFCLLVNKNIDGYRC